MTQRVWQPIPSLLTQRKLRDSMGVGKDLSQVTGNPGSTNSSFYKHFRAKLPRWFGATDSLSDILHIENWAVVQLNLHLNLNLVGMNTPI